MNCYNGEKFLNKALYSIKEQTYKNWEVIFWDNNSKDNSKKIFNSFKDNRFKYFFSRKKVNLYHSRYNALKKTTGKYIAFLDVDDWWDKNKLKKQLKLMINKNSNVSYTNFFIYNENNKKFSKQYKHSLFEGKITNKLLKSYIVGLPTIMIKKNFLKSNNINFLRKYHVIGDFDLIMRSSLVTDIHSINEPLSYYRWHSQNISSENEKLRINELKIWMKDNLKEIKLFKNFKYFKQNIIYSEMLYKKLNKKKIIWKNFIKIRLEKKIKFIFHYLFSENIKKNFLLR